MKEEEIEELLAETLEEEKSADQKPIEVSESVNSEATEQSDQGESSEQEEPVAKMPNSRTAKAAKTGRARAA